MMKAETSGGRTPSGSEEKGIPLRASHKGMIICIFLLCELVKDFEFLVLKTDQTFIAENIFCKLFTIGVIICCLRKHQLSWGSLGFKKIGILQGAALGLSLGVVTFFISYLIECLILRSMGLRPELAFYIANFAISGQNITGVSVPALVICLLGNIINVWAEEGLFRGLFLWIGTHAYTLPGIPQCMPSGQARSDRLRAKGYTKKTANLIQSGLFGLWHIIVVILWVADGSITITAALVMSAGYMLLAGILGYEWGLCALLTGTLWTGAFEHLFNNFISNSLHVITETGVDQLQIIRIVISNLLSLLIVAGLTKARNRKGSQTSLRKR